MLVLLASCIPFLASLQPVNAALELNDLQGARTHLYSTIQKDKVGTSPPAEIDLCFELCCKAGDLDEMRCLWNLVKERQDYSPSPDILEKMSWAIIRRAVKDCHPKIRFEGLIAAAMSNDAKGIEVVHNLMLDPNETLAQVALDVAGYFPDECIQKRAEKIIACDTTTCKLAAAKLLAQQKAPQTPDLLAKLLLDDDLSEKDQILVAECLAQSVDELSDETLQQYVQDRRPPMRSLAAAYALHRPSKTHLLSILPLLDDSSISVQKLSIVSLGLWQKLIPEKELHLSSYFNQCIESSDITTAANAAFALLLSPSDENQKKASAWFEKVITENSPQEALLASSRLVKCAQRATPLLKRLVHHTDLDPIVRLNMAICLLEQREDISTCGPILQAFPVQQLLSMREDSIFSWIAKTDLSHDPTMPRLPESVDLSIRLKMLALRSFANLDIDRSELEKMFQERSWGICAQAIGFTFSEFDPSLEEVVKPLLSHDIESVRIQAALLYTSINKSSEAATILAKEYAQASKEGKETLIMGFGLLPASCSLPHLAPLLCDQSLSVRTRAAGAVLTSLYK